MKLPVRRFKPTGLATPAFREDPHGPLMLYREHRDELVSVIQPYIQLDTAILRAFHEAWGDKCPQCGSSGAHLRECQYGELCQLLVQRLVTNKNALTAKELRYATGPVPNPGGG